MKKILKFLVIFIYIILFIISFISFGKKLTIDLIFKFSTKPLPCLGEYFLQQPQEGAIEISKKEISKNTDSDSYTEKYLYNPKTKIITFKGKLNLFESYLYKGKLIYCDKDLYVISYDYLYPTKNPYAHYMYYGAAIYKDYFLDFYKSPSNLDVSGHYKSGSKEYYLAKDKTFTSNDKLKKGTYEVLKFKNDIFPITINLITEDNQENKGANEYYVDSYNNHSLYYINGDLYFDIYNEKSKLTKVD